MDRTFLSLLVFVAMSLSAQAGAVRPSVVFDITQLVDQSGVVNILGGNEVALDRVGANRVLFEDLMPGANWKHPALIRVVNASGKVLEQKSVDFPPVELNERTPIVSGLATFADMGLEIRVNDFQGKYKVSNPKNFYAIFINGAADRRHYNDLVFLLKTLKNVYGYEAAHIFIADSHFLKSAPDMDGDGVPDIQFESTLEGVQSLFKKVAGILTPADHLLIATDDHGSTDGVESTLVLQDGEMKASEFAALMATLSAQSILSIHEPCYSGGFVRPTVAGNRVTMAASTNHEVSWASIDLNFNEFIYHVISAFAHQTHQGNSVNADFNGDGKVSAAEAFAYALAHDRRNESPLLEAGASSDLSQRIGFGF